MQDGKITIEEISNKADRKELQELLAERAKWTRISKDADAQAKTVTEVLLPMLERMGITNILADDDLGQTKQYLRVRGTNKTIKRDKLINQGVDPDVIDAATDEKSFWSIQVRDVKVRE